MADNAYIKQRNKILGERTVTAFNNRHFDAYYVETKEDALKKAIELIPKEGSVSWGGSMSISEIGLLDYVLENGYNVINRDTAKTPEEKNNILREALFSDTYLMSANAITEDGQLVNVDCYGNRVGALMFGPKSVIVIVGMNKIMPTIEEAVMRARNVAAPINMQRIAGNGLRQTPCFTTGCCHDCMSKESICSHITITRLCNPAKRIKVILVGETIGF